MLKRAAGAIFSFLALFAASCDFAQASDEELRPLSVVVAEEGQGWRLALRCSALFYVELAFHDKSKTPPDLWNFYQERVKRVSQVAFVLSEQESQGTPRKELQEKLSALFGERANQLGEMMRKSLLETKHPYKGSLFLAADLMICERFALELGRASK